jgi:hypothetical protein
MRSIEEVETRLRSLPASVQLRPADDRTLAEIHPWPRPDSRRRVRHAAFRVAGGVAAAVIAILLINVVAAYFAPKYELALADSSVGPISQRLLSAFGLKAGDVTLVGDSATSAGHTLKLVGAYADGLRTVLFVTIDGGGISGNPKGYGLQPGEWGINYDDMSLTDQFGRSYGGVGLGGPTDLQYQPLAWPASDVGGRLTLHITGIWAMWKALDQGANKVIDTEAFTTHGDWSLHATLISAPYHTIALPAPLHTSMADYRFTGISASETEIVLHWTVGGPANDQVRDLQSIPPSPNTDPMANPLMHDYFAPRLFDAGGTELQMQDWGFTWPKTGPAQGEMTVFINGPGRYRIQLGGAVDSRWVDVP